MITRPLENTFLLHASICVPPPWGVFHASNVRLQLFLPRERGILQASPAPLWSIPLQAISRPHRSSSSSLPLPRASRETGRQQLFSEHPGSFHTTGTAPSLHLIIVTPAYLYSCPTLAPHLSQLCEWVRESAHTGWWTLLWESRILNHSCFNWLM